MLLYPEERGYSVLVAVLGVATQGERVGDALAMARDVIAVTVRGLVEGHEPIPAKDTPPMIVAVDADIPMPAEATA